MRLGICASPTDLAAFGGEPPFDYIEGHVQNHLLPEADSAAWGPLLGALASSPVRMTAANCFLPAAIKVTGPSVDTERLRRYADTACARAAAAGVRIIVFGSGGARQVPEGWDPARGFEQFVEALKVVGPCAARHGVRIAVEPLNRGECNLVNTVDEGAEAVRRAGQPAVRLLVDLFHMLRNGETPDAIARAGDLVIHAHVAEREARTEPGVKGDDFRPFLRELTRAGYAGDLTIECQWSRPAQEAAGAALAELRRQWAESA